MTRLEVVTRMVNEQGQPLVILPMYHEAFAKLDDPGTQELIISTPRQAGKSQLGAAMIGSSLLTRPGSYSVLIAAGQAQAEAIYHRKLRRPMERLLRDLGVDKRGVIITKRSIELLETGAKCEVLASDEGTAVGRSIGEGGVLVYEECRDIPDAIFAALLPSVTSGGKVVMIGTAGAPRGFFYDAIRTPSSETWVYWVHENTNPFAQRAMVDFLARRLGVLVPSAKRRELDNEFVDDAASFLPPALIDAAIDDRLGELPTSPAPAFAFLDLSRRKDLTSLVLVLREAGRRPEAPDHLVVGSIRTWDPKASPTGETDFAEVRAAVAGLVERFPRLERLLIDEGAEAGAVLPWAKAHPALTLRVSGFIATPDSNMLLWGTLAARLHAQTISIPRHERLLAELRSLRQEQFAFGSRWRVIDSTRRFHRDVSVALAGAVMAAGEVGTPAADVGVEAAYEGVTRGGDVLHQDDVAEAGGRERVAFWERRGASRFWR